MAEENIYRKFVQFDGTNWNSWKFRVNVLLDEKNLTDYIEHDLAELMHQAIDDEDELKCVKEEKKCKAILVQCIADTHLEYVQDKKRAKEMYDALKAVYERKSVAGQLYLRKKLITLKYEESDEMNEHFLVFDKTVRELKAIGAKLEDLDIICHLLLSLPKSYNNLVTALETLDPDKLTISFVKGRLLDEFTKRKQCEGSITSKSNPSVAMSASESNFKFKCYRCQKPGHKWSQCKVKFDKKSPSTPDKSKSEKNANVASKFSDDSDDDEIGIAFGMFEKWSKPIADQKALISVSSALQRRRRIVKFFLDSAATSHMVNDVSLMVNVRKISEEKVRSAKKGASITSNTSGDINGILANGNGERKCCLRDVLYMEDLCCNLISIGKMEKAGMDIHFKNGAAYILYKDEVVYVAQRSGDTYQIELIIEEEQFAGICAEGNKILWHNRMGHLNMPDLQKLVGKEMVTGIELKSKDNVLKFCEPCVLGKKSRHPFPARTDRRSNRPLELIHSDVCGPIVPVAWEGSKYFMTFIDDYTHFTVVYMLQRKSEVFSKFQQYTAMAETHFQSKIGEYCSGPNILAYVNTKIERMKGDNGGENSSNEFLDFCVRRGIQFNHTVPYNPELNSVAERMNRTLMEKARTMVLAGKVQKQFWNEAFLTATFLTNRSPTSALVGENALKTPAELWYGKKPDLKYLKIFGSIAYNHVPKECRTKLDSKAVKTVMMGYTTNGYRLFDPEKRKIVVGRNVTFDESGVTKQESCVDIYEENHRYEPRSEPATTTMTNEELGSGTSSHSESQDDSVPLRRSERIRRAPDWYTDDRFNANMALNAEQYVQNDPLTLQEAKGRSDWNLWKEAMDAEYNSLMKNETWTLCDLPSNREAIKSKWVFKIKRKFDGTIDKYKARLCAKGYSQKKGFDYNETYAPVAKLTTFRTLMAIACHENLYIHQMDVNSAFLNGFLDEEIYMVQPEGYEIGNKTCKLKRSIYGLKQSPRMWNLRLHNFLVKSGFQRTESDSCLYIRFMGRTKFFLLLYVDDLILISNSLQEIQWLKRKLSEEFEMTDLGEMETYLGIHMVRDTASGTMMFSQKQYLINTLNKFEMGDCKPVVTPMEVGLKLGKTGNVDNDLPYRELIGCLMYVSLSVRPDLAASANFFSRYQGNYNQEHFMYAKRILKYIKGTLNLQLVYKRNENAEPLTGYADADWANDPFDRKSISGYVFQVFGNVVSWSSRKQTTVSLSSTEAEYIALTECACEAIWLRKLLKEIRVECDEPTTLYEDNQSCIRIADTPKDNKRMKHVDTKYHFIRQTLLDGDTRIEYVPSEDQLADIMTKPLPPKQFVKLRERLGLSN